MKIEDNHHFEHENGKEYTVRVGKTYSHDPEKECEVCGLTTKGGSHGILIEIVEMYDENYVDVSKKSPIYRAAKKRYAADGKWHFMCDRCRKSNADLYDDDDLSDLYDFM